MSINNTDAEDYFGKPVYTYTRKELIDNGFLADLTALYPNDTKKFYKWPVACKREIWDLIENVDEPGMFVHDMCYMSISASQRKVLSNSVVIFPCWLPLKSNNLKTKEYWLKIKVDAGDNGDPVITILFANQD